MSSKTNTTDSRSTRVRTAGDIITDAATQSKAVGQRAEAKVKRFTSVWTFTNTPIEKAFLQTLGVVIATRGEHEICLLAHYSRWTRYPLIVMKAEIPTGRGGKDNGRKDYPVWM